MSRPLYNLGCYEHKYKLFRIVDELAADTTTCSGGSLSVAAMITTCAVSLGGAAMITTTCGVSLVGVAMNTTTFRRVLLSVL